MQYLSKAYNYYSGINPATLSGAIDVIVVRHVAADGTVTLSSSPFHVRFGKLQVLRAAEKRVTIRMPNNLPAPHIAPFDMKVGESGEAFFVVETDEQVPEDLLTSPIVAPTETELPPTPPLSDDQAADEHGGSVTHEPFGSTEKQVPHEEPLGDVDFLDLNATPDTPSKATHSATASPLRRDNPLRHNILGTASNILPQSMRSAPSTPTKPQAPARQPSIDDNAPNDEAKAKEEDRPVVSNTDKEPNPIEAHAGDRPELPARDKKLSSYNAAYSASSAEKALPKVPAGQGEGPEVLYGKDVVLDMDGYHSAKDAETQQGEHDATVETFIQDLISSVQSTVESRPKPRKSLSLQTEAERPFDDQDVSPALSPRQSSPDLDLSTTLSGLSMDGKKTHFSNVASHNRLERGQSEPPQTFHTDDLSKSPDTQAKDVVEREWDWSRPQPDTPDNGGEQHNVTGSLKNVEENPFLFVLEVGKHTHSFELSLCEGFGKDATEAEQEAMFVKNRITFQRFIEDSRIIDNPAIVVGYNDLYFTWSSGYRLLYGLAVYRRTLAPPNASPSSPTLPAMSLVDAGGDIGSGSTTAANGTGWSKWWRRGQSNGSESSVRQGQSETAPATTTPVPGTPKPESDAPVQEADGTRHFAKTLRLSSDQLEQLHLKPGPNTISFSVSSSYSGLAVCTSRIFLWEETDQIVISDIDGTITKSDALGHVFAAIGRDWTHLGIAKLYTDICNNGYKILYLTSRAIGQADTTREYLKSIAQGQYRMPEGPVLMSPDRLMASLHRREVIMRKPELFKMACLRDIQRLFGEQAKEAFYAGFGNRITDAMSYRSVGIEASKIYTIDSTGVVKTELLQSAGHKGSYIQLNDLVNEVFPTASSKVKPEYTDFNYWRDPVPDIPLPDLTPPSPALSARSDTSGRYSVIGKITGMARRSSRATHPNGSASTSQVDPSSRPSSPLMAPSLTSMDMSEGDEEDDERSLSSMPGSFEDDKGELLDEVFFASGSQQSRPGHREEEDGREESDGEDDEDGGEGGQDDSYDDDAIFDDDILAAGEMQNVPF
ncbi:phosphatidate phosphatase LPIN [Cryptococcus wingfieldii CBS 7118]|uniref:phosphatidate phosphatase n=1 Tax=Cryptococcus wingfieldii CBS 7118 TaxID=1295528 RepID=A0A1E3J760_9TREE|nr:phosphatidate phosphatase LPIN [Cryptococcus wingfieldii CBS 7118]ODN96515.1 phosphatidate phosphatase LPIN [Cryptococcus wingfieldii CBS 7118]